MKTRSNKDQAYWERNQLVLYMTKLFPAWLEKHPEKDPFWEKDWRNIIFIKLQEGLMCWHIHDSELEDFKHLDFKDGDSWDGKTTEEKYAALRSKSPNNCQGYMCPNCWGGYLVGEEPMCPFCHSVFEKQTR